MHIRYPLQARKRWYQSLLIFAVFINASAVLAGDMLSTICRNEVVSVGDRRGEVLAKCGPPLSKGKEAEERQVTQIKQKKKTSKNKAALTQDVTTRKKTVKERAETWTYNIDGSYRFFVFKEGRLDRIEAGGLAN